MNDPHAAIDARARFAGGVAVVTGAAAGVGEGLVRHLAQIGMTSVVADIDVARAERVAESIRDGGGRAEACHVDVVDPASVDALAASVFDRHGGVDLLIANAGVESAGLLWEIDPRRWRTVMNVNVDGVFHCVRSFVPRMIAAGTPSCVATVSSVGGINSVAVQSPYIVSKFAVEAMTEALHQDLAVVGAPIQVSVLIPHSIRSEIFRAARRDAPTENPVANAVFDAMQRDNESTGLDPLVAAEHMVAQIARGDFWIHSDDRLCTAALERRARQLLDSSPPADPRAMLDRMGVPLPKGSSS
ncbi:SDR family NAD(P)-dependent oxidoreductase [Dietzia sp. CH92]|uniref:SDR family NAD(P)-dependent oxidoreductase n=1 Tax=Dietzia sp. CH92 TaxID=3051823 RepID=UPI0028D02C0A|nr:SDR family NAD(P)-dependent oxidoreductase [Dietzia sp. CH92]